MHTRLALLATLSLLSLTLGVGSSLAQTRIGGERPTCVQVSSNARFDGVGFGHWVSVNNTCDHTVECDISTNVAPSPTHVTLTRGQRQDVNTFLSSPAREFTATVSCPER